MSLDRCSTCNEIVWKHERRPHECKPVFEVNYEPWYGEDEWQEVFAYDHEGAAEKWGDDSDSNSGEYDIVSGKSSPVVKVRKKGEDEIQEWVVTGEAVPQYSAERAVWCAAKGCITKADEYRLRFLDIDEIPHCQTCYRRVKDEQKSQQ